MKMHFQLAALLLSASIAAGQSGDDAGVPVAPISSLAFEGWTNAFELQNPAITIVIVPSVGRIAKISYKGGNNLLRLDTGLQDNGDSWINHGGDWIWPVAQSRWTTIAKTDPGFAGGSAEASWPPPSALAEKPWTGTAWKDADGTLCCQMAREYGEPINIKVSRSIKLDKEAARFTIRQRIERTAPSELPVVLWNISQIAGASRVVIPQGPNSMFEKGVKALLFAMPDDKRLTSCGHALVYDATEGEHKLGSDSKRSWIAAQKGDVAIVERAISEDTQGTHPDGGCAVEMYSNAGLGYSEIETLSVEKKLLPGESLQNLITVDLLEAGSGLSACELADAICATLGETPEIQPPAELAAPAEMPTMPQE
jgi:hypothetical protein